MIVSTEEKPAYLWGCLSKYSGLYHSKPWTAVIESHCTSDRLYTDKKGTIINHLPY